MGNEKEIQGRGHKTVLDHHLYRPDMPKFDRIREKLTKLYYLLINA